MPAVKSVEEYIRAAPPEWQAILRKVRAAIRAAAPDAEEGLSYGMPFYGYKGEVGIDRRLCYFRVQRASLRIYLRPRDLDPHAARIATYRSTKSALHFSRDQPIPIPLLQKLVRDAVRRHRTGSARPHRKGKA